MKERKAYEQKLKTLSKLSRTLEKEQKDLMNVNLMYENSGTNAIIRFLSISQMVFARLKETWQNLQLFNDKMSTNIKVSLGEQLKKLFDYGSKLDITEANEKREYAKGLLHDVSFECSTMAYIIQHQSQLYVNVSKKFIIPAVSELETLNSFDPVQGCRIQGGCKPLIDEKLQEIDTVLNKRTKEIEGEIKNDFDKFAAKFEQRIKNLEEAFNVLIESLAGEFVIKQQCKKATRVCKFNSFSGKTQRWKLDDNMLKNKAGVWKSVDSWDFTTKDDDWFYIRNNSTTKVFEATSDGKVIQEVLVEGKADQLWKKGEADAEGYFTLRNSGEPKVLTAISESSLEIKGMR